MIRSAWLVFVGVLAADSPLASFEHQVEAAYPGTPTVAAAEVLAGPSAMPPVLVDARTEEERAVSMLPGAIEPEALGDTPRGDGRRVVVYCTIGMRSAALTQRLRADGWDAYNLRGGVLAWAEAGGRFVAPDGTATRRVHVYGRAWSHLPPGFDPVW